MEKIDTDYKQAFKAPVKKPAIVCNKWFGR